MPRTLGVEEEFHVVDLKTRRLTARAPELLDELSDTYVAELQACVVEMNSGVVDTLDGLRADLQGHRHVLVAAAAKLGMGVVAAGAVPLSVPAEMQVTQTARYRQMLADYQLLAREQLICGTQVHIGLEDRDESVAVANRVSPYLPTLLALSASSPFWSDGSDTGYSSVRTLVWQRWPTTGLAAPVSTAAEYDRLVNDLVASGVITDEGMVYFDVRPANAAPTLELRVCDSCPSVDTIVLIAGLFRALVEREVEGLRAGVPAVEVAPPLGRAALWRAARSGLEGELVDISGPRSRPAAEVVTELVRLLRPQLEAAGDWQMISELTRQVLIAGTSAARQRRELRRRGRLTDVVDQLIAETAGSWPNAAAAVGEDPSLLFGYHPNRRVRPRRQERRGQLRRGRRPRRPAAATLRKDPAHRRRTRCRRAAVPGTRHRAGPARRQHHLPGQGSDARAAVPRRPDAAAGGRRRVGGAHRGSGSAGQGAECVPARHLFRAGHRRRRRHRCSGPRPGTRVPLDGPAVAAASFAPTSAAPTWYATAPETGWCSRTTCASRRAPPTRSSTGGC